MKSGLAARRSSKPTNTRATYEPILIASIQTVAHRGHSRHAQAPPHRRGARRPGQRGLSARSSSEYDGIVIGLSATPFAKGLGKFFDVMIEATTIAKLIARWLPGRRRYLRAQRARPRQGPKVVAGDYNVKQLGAAVNKEKLIGDIVENWRALAAGQPTVCFAVDVAHSMHIVRQFEQAGIAAAHIDAYTPEDERLVAIERLQAGDVKVLSNVAVLAEGWDCPEVQVMILARPTKSLSRYIQMAGRILRPNIPVELATREERLAAIAASIKPRGLILDHSGTAKRLGFPTEDLPLELDDGKPRPKAAQQVAAPRMPTVCMGLTNGARCGYLKPPGVHTCPACGFTPEPQTDVQVVPATLTKAKREILTVEQKQRIYQELAFYQIERQLKPGWVYHRYKARTGAYPPTTFNKLVPVETSPELRSWIRSQNIRYAKGKANEAKPEEQNQ
jgi:hypothetical protein